MWTQRFHERHIAGPGGIGELWPIALPMIASTAFDTAMMFVNRLFLARVDPLQMAACMSGGITCFTFMVLPLGVVGYVTSVVAHLYGAKRTDECARTVTQGFLLALCGYPLILALLPLGEASFRWAGHAAAQIPYETTYFRICLFGGILGLLRCPLASFFSGIGRTRVIMLSNLVGMVVNLTVSYVLVFGRLGFPALGIRGAAIAFLTSSAAVLSVLLTAYLRPANRREFRIAQAWRFDRPLMAKLLRFGTPCGIESILNLAAFTVLISMFHGAGAQAAQAITIVFNWDMVSFVPMLGLQVAVMSLVGQHLGRGQPAAAERAAYSGLKVNLLYSGLLMVLYVSVPGLLVDVFRPDHPAADYAEVERMARAMVMMMPVYLLSDGMFIVFSGALRGAGDTTWTMWVSNSLHWVSAAQSFAWNRVLRLNPVTAWAILVFSFPWFGFVFWWRFRQGRWKQNRLLDDMPAPSPEPVPETVES